MSKDCYRKPSPPAFAKDGEPLFCEECYLRSRFMVQMRRLSRNVYSPEGELLVSEGTAFCPHCGDTGAAVTSRLKKLEIEEEVARQAAAERRQEAIYKWLM